MLNVSRHLLVNPLRVNLTPNSGFVYQHPQQKRNQAAADRANAEKESLLIGQPENFSFSEQTKTSNTVVHALSGTTAVSENSPLPVFKMPALSELPTGKQKALMTYQTVANTALPTSIEIVGIDLFV